MTAWWRPDAREDRRPRDRIRVGLLRRGAHRAGSGRGTRPGRSEPPCARRGWWRRSDDAEASRAALERFAEALVGRSCPRHALRVPAGLSSASAPARRGADTWPGHRRRGGDVRPDPGCAADAAALRGSRAPGADRARTRRRRALRPTADDRAMAGLARRGTGRRPRPVSLDLQLHGARRRQSGDCRHGRHARLLQGVGPRARSRPHVPGVGGRERRAADGHHSRLRVVAAQLQQRPGHHR